MKYTRNIYQIKTAMNSTALLVMAVVFAFSSILAPRVVDAQSSLQDQIRVLEHENRQNRSIIADLMKTATSYSQAIEQLQTQVNQLEAEITQNEAQKADLERQIAELQQELERQKHVLGTNIKAMYVGGEMTTLEMLVTSKDLSEYVDKEAYRNAVQAKIQTTMTKIATIQNQLNDKKVEIEGLIANLQTKRATVDAARAEQANLLAMNQQQQADFNQKTRDNKARIAQLQQQIDEQRSLNNRTVITDGGIYFIRFPGAVGSFNPNDYEYRDYGFSMRPEGCGYYDPNTGQTDSMDRWGYCTRQCVSFTAWAVEASGRVAPKWYGNAKNWINKAPSSYVYRSPQVGDVAITTGGTYGHAMYVAEVSGNRFLAWEYNQGLRGELKTYRWITWR